MSIIANLLKLRYKPGQVGRSPNQSSQSNSSARFARVRYCGTLNTGVIVTRYTRGNKCPALGWKLNLGQCSFSGRALLTAVARRGNMPLRAVLLSTL